jgi:hypothetical protein
MGEVQRIDFEECGNRALSEVIVDPGEFRFVLVSIDLHTSF